MCHSQQHKWRCNAVKARQPRAPHCTTCAHTPRQHGFTTPARWCAPVPCHLHNYSGGGVEVAASRASGATEPPQPLAVDEHHVLHTIRVHIFHKHTLDAHHVAGHHKGCRPVHKLPNGARPRVHEEEKVAHTVVGVPDQDVVVSGGSHKEWQAGAGEMGTGLPSAGSAQSSSGRDLQRCHCAADAPIAVNIQQRQQLGSVSHNQLVGDHVGRRRKHVHGPGVL